MKRFAISTVAFVVLLGAGLACACFFLPSRTAGLSMLDVQKTKLERLSQIQGARIVLVGGSGLGMGMKTSELAKALNRPVYNMGLHAGLGLVYQLCAPLPDQLRAGDVVVIVPEYANFTEENCFGNQELVAMLSDVLPEHRNRISFAHWMRLWQSVAQYGAGKIRKCFLPRGETAHDHSGDYDAFGDAKWGRRTPDAQLPVLPGKQLSAENFSPVVLRHIRSYVDDCRERGIRVVLLPPAFHAPSYDNQSDYIQKVAQELEYNGTPFLVSPRRYRLPAKCFYDTAYHLNLLGREQRVKLMIEDLRRVL